MRIEMPEKRKKYDREFREAAVRIVEETGKPIGTGVATPSAARSWWRSRRPVDCMVRLGSCTIYATTGGPLVRRRSRIRCAVKDWLHAGSNAGTG